ncbi:MAG: biopolymer transporter ExbD [Fibrobacterales bacterium]|nr:biopolymer transporter ExbD [Fibrobacterales bacterium]MBP5350679.1 biopolymer transporter ExbD [Fibrobacterales bacterium]
MPRKARKYGGGGDDLNITSLMDAMTIILVFLLKNLDAEGNLLTQADNLRLPSSSSQKTIQEVLLTVVVDNNHVLVDNTPVIETDLVVQQDSLFIAPMVEALQAKREEEKMAALASGGDADSKGSVIVQLDKMTSYDVMYKTMASCGFSGYGNVRFAVLQRNAE